MAEYAINIQAKVEDAIRGVTRFSRSLFGLAATTKKVQLGVGKASSGAISSLVKQRIEIDKTTSRVLAMGGFLAGTSLTLAFIGASVETAMFRSRSAIERTGVSAKALAADFIAAGASATELLPVAAKFAFVGVAGKNLKVAADRARDMGHTMGMSAQAAGADLSDLTGQLDLTGDGINRLGYGLIALQHNYADAYAGNLKLLKGVGSTFSALKLSEGALLAANAALAATNTAMQMSGVSANKTTALSTAMGESFKFGTEGAAAMALRLGMLPEKLEEFLAADPSKQLRMMAMGMSNIDPLTLSLRFHDLGLTLGDAENLIRQFGDRAEATDAVFDSLTGAFADTAEGQKVVTEWSKTLHGALALLWESVKGLTELIGPVFSGALYLVIYPISEVVKWLRQWPDVAGPVTGTLALAASVFTLVKAFRLLRSILAFPAALAAVGKAAAVASLSVAGMGVAAGAATAPVIGVGGAAGVALEPIIGVGIAAGAATAPIIGVGGAAGAATAPVAGFGAAAWAAIAPLLPFIALAAAFVAAAFAIAYAIKVVVDNWEGIKDAVSDAWGAIKDFFADAWAGTKRFVSNVGAAIADPFIDLWSMISSLGEKIGGVLGVIASPFKAVGGWFSSLVGPGTPLAGAEVAAPRAKFVDQAPEPAKWRADEPVPVITSADRALSRLSPALIGRQSLGGPAGSGAGRDMSPPPPIVGAAGAGEGPVGGGTVRVAIPVTVHLDGYVVGRAMSEHEINLGRERYMNAPKSAMRGTGG